MKVYTENIDSIDLCFKWIYNILYYGGCLSFQLRRKTLQLTKGNIVYTHFIRSALILSFVGSIALKNSSGYGSKAMLDQLSPVLKLILGFETFTSTVTYIAVTSAMHANRYKHLKLLFQFKELDEQMQATYPKIKWNYHKTMRKFTPITLCGMFYYYAVSLIYVFNLSNCNCDYATTLMFALSYASITITPGCTFFLHLGMMDLQRIRYRLIQRLLRQEYCGLRKDASKQCKFKLRITRLIDYYKRYIELILQINDVFGVVCGISLFHDFTVLTNMTFLMCQKATESGTRSEEYVFIFLFMLPRIYKVTIYAVYGYVTQMEQRNCAHEIRMSSKYFRSSLVMRNKLSAFLHWQMQKKYTFLVGRMTRCNLILLYTTVNSIASSVIILIQLQFQQNSITERMKNGRMLQDVELI
ncbi:putative gustatory receptor 47b [Ceratitis capitata]|uniref:Gustatory receptor n=1 Tax=Ceratitis capitata TaxID=7213 RepID=A0A811VEA0_CERCA|nr:putative gustatory receptor 47b [Ceratitis capitata]CAD7013577.1 unnamed protein product [Ceratitis capitata]